MKAVMSDVPELVLQWRAQTGADRWDEMWDGVLHMPPMPNRDHQDLEGSLETWLRAHWSGHHGRQVFHQINVASVGGWPTDYRIPDLILLTRQHPWTSPKEYMEGPPAVAIEIRSPGDESLEKLPFYEKIGVPEVWVVDRDTKLPELYRLDQGRYTLQYPDAEGWLESATTDIRLRGGEGKLEIQLAGNARTRRRLPED